MIIRKNIKIFFCTLLGTLLCFSIYWQPHYSTDAYMSFLETPFSAKGSLSLGRPFLTLVSYVLSIFHINAVKNQELFFCVLLLSVVFAVSSHYILLVEYAKGLTVMKKYILYLFCLSAYLNIFVDEWFRFPEAYLMFGLALFCASIGILFFVKDHYAAAFLSLFAALGFYQAVLGIFINWVIGIIFVRFHDDIRKIVKKVTCCIVMAGTASMINILSTSAFVALGWSNHNPRQASFSIELIWNNIKSIVAAQKTFLINGYSLLPQNLLLICLSILIILLFSSNWKRSLVYAGMLLLLYTSPFLPFIVSGDVWMAQRTVVPYFSIFSVIAVVICAENGGTGKKEYVIQAVTGSIGLCLLLVNIRAVNKIAVEHISINKIDYALCKSIEQKIVCYEQGTGCIVDTVAIAQDEALTYSYPGITTTVYDTNISALKVPWCLSGLFKYAMDRNIQVISMDEGAFQNWFAGRNWDVHSLDEQIRFQGNIMYFVLW